MCDKSSARATATQGWPPTRRLPHSSTDRACSHVTALRPTWDDASSKGGQVPKNSRRHVAFPHDAEMGDISGDLRSVKTPLVKLGVSPKPHTRDQEPTLVPGTGDRSSKTSASQAQQSTLQRQIIYRFAQRFEKYLWRAYTAKLQKSKVATSFQSQDLPSVGAEIPGLFSSSSLPPSLVPGHLAASFMSRAPAVAGALFVWRCLA